jgi:hypothetical protein
VVTLAYGWRMFASRPGRLRCVAALWRVSCTDSCTHLVLGHSASGCGVPPRWCREDPAACRVGSGGLKHRGRQPIRHGVRGGSPRVCGRVLQALIALVLVVSWHWRVRATLPHPSPTLTVTPPALPGPSLSLRPRRRHGGAVLSAWEVEWLRLYGRLTCRSGWTGVAVADPRRSWLIAR